MKLTDIINHQFYECHDYLNLDNKKTHFWLSGGRGSTKSSFVSVEIPYGIIKDMNNGIVTNAVVFRRYKNNLRGSVYQQMLWAVRALGIKNEVLATISPMEIKFKNGNKIIFVGADDTEKVKSIKSEKGYFKYIWFEEITEYQGILEVNDILRSLMRGGDYFKVFYTYNPHPLLSNWVNMEAEKKSSADDKYFNLTNYLEVDESWLGKQFIVEAEKLRIEDNEKYRHVYLGEKVGLGGEIFNNVVGIDLTKLSKSFDGNLKYGLDWGFANDPLHFTANFYDKKKNNLYVFDEFRGLRITNSKLSEHLYEKGYNNCRITADSAEPKSIAECKDIYGIRHIEGAKKGKGSIEHGIKWLQDINKIYICNKNCKESLKEMISYSLKIGKDGKFISQYPDENNHFIDALRYSREDETNERKIKKLK